MKVKKLDCTKKKKKKKKKKKREREREMMMIHTASDNGVVILGTTLL
jgi:hypothetical protein